MNDRTTAVLEQYDIRVLRLLKGRGAVLCETEDGWKILKEYKGSGTKLWYQSRLLEEIKNRGYLHVEQIIPSKEGELTVKEEDGTLYYLKDYSNGKECNIREYKDCMTAMTCMARLHQAMEGKEFAEQKEVPFYHAITEIEKQNRELRKIKKYLREKRQKTEFEYFLLQNFDLFLEKAERVLEGMKEHKELFSEEKIRSQGSLCHGDLQHHNLLLWEGKGFFINFEKAVVDSPIRDLALFFRKMMEKNNWSQEMGNHALEAYERIRALTEEEKIQLRYRLSYPEKFRKIANFYYNSSKAWIPDKNREKLEKILLQEQQRREYLKQLSF